MTVEQSQLYQGFAGNPLGSQIPRYYPTHASFEPKPYREAVNSFRRQFIASAIEDLSSHGKIVNYKNLASLLYESRYIERQITQTGLKPFLMHYYTEQGMKRELSPEQIASYTPWKQSLDSRVVEDVDIFEHPNINPDIRISAVTAKIIEEARSTGKYNLKDATDRFRALYVASVVKRLSEERYTRTLAEPKAKAARYLKVSTRTIDRMLDEAEKLGYAKIAKIQDPDTKYAYELISLENPKNQPEQVLGIEEKLDRSQ